MNKEIFIQDAHAAKAYKRLLGTTLRRASLNFKLHERAQFNRHFRYVETLFVQGINIVSSRAGISWWSVNEPW